MKKITKKRFGGIDLLKHLLAIFVIIQHMRSESRYSNETNLLISNIVQYVNGAVIGFIMISGFFFKPVHNIREGLTKIFKRTMIPFFIFSSLYTVLMYLLDKGTLIAGFINTINFHGASMQLYYLSYLFFIYCFFLLIFYVKNTKKSQILIVLIIISTVISLIIPTDSPTGPSYKLIPIYVLSFGIGNFLSCLRKGNTKTYLMISISISIIGLMIGRYDYRFYHISAMILLILISYFSSNNLSFLNRQFPGSGGVYLFHTPIINFAISTILISLNIIESQNFFITIILTYIVTLIMTLIFIKIFPRYRSLVLE